MILRYYFNMNTIKEILTKWSINKRKLENPFIILIRLILYIPIKILGYILYLMVWTAWDKYSADTIRKELP